MRKNTRHNPTRRATKKVEKDVLSVFKKEIPSIHFSDKAEKDYHEWTSQAAYIYRDLLHIPPKLFSGASVIDFGAGTGENTIPLANWGAMCTLVDINAEALKIAKKVFKRYDTRQRKHRFSCSSIFYYADTKQYNFVCALGSLHHTNEKERAFSIISSFLKPDGYLILGMSSPVGGFQNNLQRIICYKFAETDEEIVEVAERLFREDIDRAQAFGKRSRRSIIFDRWVVPKQDDPTVEQVLDWFRKNGIRFYHSYPPIVLPALADSAHHVPRFELTDWGGVGGWSEAFWLTHRDSDAIEVPAALQTLPPFSSKQSKMASFVNNIEPSSRVDLDELEALIEDHLATLSKLDLTSFLKHTHRELFAEILGALKILRIGDLNGITKYLSEAKHMFRGMNGLRNIYYVGWKDETLVGSRR